MVYELIQRSKDEMESFMIVVNTNYYKLKPYLKNKYQHQAYFLTPKWVEKNYTKHFFYIFHNSFIKTKPIGSVSFKKIVDFAYIEYFFIHDTLTRQGYGKIMMDLIEKKILDRGLTKIRLFVHKDAIWAQNAYKKYGFKLVLSDKSEIREFENSRLAPYFITNHLLYEKKLNNF